MASVKFAVAIKDGAVLVLSLCRPPSQAVVSWRLMAAAGTKFYDGGVRRTICPTVGSVSPLLRPPFNQHTTGESIK